MDQNGLYSFLCCTLGFTVTPATTIVILHLFNSEFKKLHNFEAAQKIVAVPYKTSILSLVDLREYAHKRVVDI